MSNVTCEARRVNDEMHCGRCGYQWDVKDPDKPQCKNPCEVIRAKHNLTKQEKPKCRIFPK